MGAKEDLIAKMQAAEAAKINEQKRLADLAERFGGRLTALYDQLESDLDGIPGLTTSRILGAIGAGQNQVHSSLIISFLGETIQFEPRNRDGLWGVASKNLGMFDMHFTPNDKDDWTGQLLTEDISTLTGELIISRLSQIVDEASSDRVSPWD